MQICIYDRYIFACGKLVESSDHETNYKVLFAEII